MVDFTAAEKRAIAAYWKALAALPATVRIYNTGNSIIACRVGTPSSELALHLGNSRATADGFSLEECHDDLGG